MIVIFFSFYRVVLLNGLAGSRGIQMNKTHLTATITMAVRPLAGADYSDKIVNFILLSFYQTRAIKILLMLLLLVN